MASDNGKIPSRTSFFHCICLLLFLVLLTQCGWSLFQSYTTCTMRSSVTNNVSHEQSCLMYILHRICPICRFTIVMICVRGCNPVYNVSCPPMQITQEPSLPIKVTVHIVMD
ncbi:uncharacterized protein BYT42DRAFT_301940 [Radiomyces spectabilis]|uniref:uncharacterized protein n=1 Tax=Radiomyces spectabilis TaxID=64574 RepID=UPI00221E6E8C|nr:uncharacterized protein BYT42DRAFT_301940 [Radiomyces spectabilis]KAI8381341.1 hypothetical protein BYT42DRAFT_301940 [Radiomyces spectabilis]